MGFGRLVTRRRRGTSSVVPVVVLGAAVSLGVVAVTASRFGWRRTKSDKTPAEAPATETSADDAAPRHKQIPPRAPGAPRWDSPPPELTSARAKPDPPSP
jgi:hypothetical protein